MLITSSQYLPGLDLTGDIQLKSLETDCHLNDGHCLDSVR